MSKEGDLIDYCECGCGLLVGTYKTSYRSRGIVKGQPKRFVTNHHTCHERNTRWKHGINDSGNYTLITVKGHPFAISGRYVYLHRLIYENYLKATEPLSPALINIDGERYLSPAFIVHHKDGNCRDNDLLNLELMSKGEHSMLHYPFIPKINGKLTKAEVCHE